MGCFCNHWIMGRASIGTEVKKAENSRINLLNMDISAL